MIGVLLRPKWQSFRNRWRKQSLAKRRTQDLAVLVFSLGIMIGMYRGASWVLHQLDNLPFLIYAPPSIPLGILLLMLLGMVAISSLATVLGAFYFADDIELVLASPVPYSRFYISRLLYCTFTVSWMPFVFIFPMLLAFGTTYHAPLGFYPMAIFTLLPYFLIPTALAVIVSALAMAVIDPRWTKLLIALSLGLGIAGLVHVADLLSSVVIHRKDPNQILRLVSTFSAGNSLWSPSSWAATAISELLKPSGRSFDVRIVLLYTTALSVAALGYMCIDILHGIGFTRARNTSKAIKRSPMMRRTRRLLASPKMALITKEFKAIFRDLSQSTQVMFLATICLLYLANMRIFVAIESFPVEQRFWWQNMFFIMHTSITAFFTSSICTRVVYSSISLEGKQYWLLQVAPIDIDSILQSKLTAWFIPVSIISAILFSTGVFIIIGRWDMLALYLLISFSVSYGIVGLGIGLGAYFADFSWDHPSQLALSLGSFVYMLASAALVILNIFPLTILLRLDPPTTLQILCNNIAWTFLMGALVAILNLYVARGALRLGQQSLKNSAAM